MVVHSSNLSIQEEPLLASDSSIQSIKLNSQAHILDRDKVRKSQKLIAGDLDLRRTSPYQVDSQCETIFKRQSMIENIQRFEKVKVDTLKNKPGSRISNSSTYSAAARRTLDAKTRKNFYLNRNADLVKTLKNTEKAPDKLSCV